MAKTEIDTRYVKVKVGMKEAREWLSTVQPTYRFRTNHYLRLRTDMRRNAFLSEDSIPLVIEVDSGKPEVLHNGRHRLAAQVAEGREYTYWVAYMSPERAARWDIVGDNAAPWTLADHLRHIGVKEATQVASSLSYLHRFQTGAVLARQLPTRGQALDLLDHNQRITEYLSTTRGAARGFRISHGMCTATAYLTSLFKDVPQNDITEFWTVLDGLSSRDLEEQSEVAGKLEHGNPMMSYANWLRRTMPSRSRSVRRSENLTWALLVKTWDSYITREPLHRPRWGAREKFPALIDPYGTQLVAGGNLTLELTGGSTDAT